MYQILIEIAILIIYTFIMLSYFYKTEPHSIKWNQFYLSCLLIAFVYFVLIIFIPSLNSILNIMLFTCIFTRFVQMSGVGNYKVLYFVEFYIFLLMIMNVIINSSFMILFQVLLKQGGALTLQDSLKHIITRLLLVVSLGIGFYRFYPDNIQKMSNQNDFKRPIILTITGLNIILMLLSLMYTEIENIWGNILHVIVCIGILFCYACFENYLSKSCELSEKIEEIKFIEQRMENQYSQFKEQNEYVSSLRKIKHDISNALINITYLLQDYKYEDALSCIQSCSCNLSIPSKQFQTYSDNFLLNADLSWIDKNLKLKGIGFSATVKVGNMDIRDKKIWNVILDLIDHAIVMSEKVSEKLQRYVNIRGNIVNEWLVINIENKITKEDVIYYKEQESSDCHLYYYNEIFESLKRRVEEMDGIVSVDVNENENLLKVTIGIPSYRNHI